MRHIFPSRIPRLTTPTDAPEREGQPSRKTAVALKYDPGTTDAPRVVASGRGPIAEQIIAVAEAHGISVREDRDLAEILAAVEVDSQIPLEAWAAVAEILSYIYRANRTPLPAAAQGREER
jgi:flagellar biosynthesis protein